MAIKITDLTALATPSTNLANTIFVVVNKTANTTNSATLNAVIDTALTNYSQSTIKAGTVTTANLQNTKFITLNSQNNTTNLVSLFDVVNTATDRANTIYDLQNYVVQFTELTTPFANSSNTMFLVEDKTSATQKQVSLTNLITTGTWVPSLTFGGANTGLTYGTVRRGSYTKVGSMVLLEAEMVLTASGSSTGAVWIENLPFAATSNTILTISIHGSTTALADPYALTQLGSTTAVVYADKSDTVAAPGTATTKAAIGATSTIRLVGQYKV